MLSSSRETDSEVGSSPRSAKLLILDPASRGASSSGIVAFLEAQGHHVAAVGSPDEALPMIRRMRPDLLIMATGALGPESPRAYSTALGPAARELGIPILAVFERVSDLSVHLSGADEVDDWVMRGASLEELGARVARLLRTGASLATVARSSSSPIDVGFSALVVHDLRTPLNVIGLSLRMIEQVLPRDDPEVEEDLRFIDENFRQIERMLSQLSDYTRLYEPGLELSASEFDPRRLVNELLENREARSGGKGPSVQLEVKGTCPREATLDQGRARMAIEYALVNAVAATTDDPVRVTLRGDDQRWIIEVAIDRPPPACVRSVELRPQAFERLCGSAAERRGMDLAIAARVSELFHGTARLDVDPKRGTTVILDWPVRITDSPSAR